MALKWSMMNISHPLAILLAMKDHKYPSLCRIYMVSQWDNNKKWNGVQIQVTSEETLTNYHTKTKHIPNTSSKTKHIKEVMELFQHKMRMKRRQQ